jgi:hypothetical protein
MGLPGNPVSAMVTFDLFARPAILKMMGRDWHAAAAEAELAHAERSDGRRTYMRVRLERANGRLIAHSTGNQSSGVLTSLVNADGLLIIPEGMTDIPAGTRLPVRLLKNCEVPGLVNHTAEYSRPYRRVSFRTGTPGLARTCEHSPGCAWRAHRRVPELGRTDQHPYFLHSDWCRLRYRPAIRLFEDRSAAGGLPWSGR